MLTHIITPIIHSISSIHVYVHTFNNSNNDTQIYTHKKSHICIYSVTEIRSKHFIPTFWSKPCEPKVVCVVKRNTSSLFLANMPLPFGSKPFTFVGSYVTILLVQVILFITSIRSLKLFVLLVLVVKANTSLSFLCFCGSTNYECSNFLIAQ